MASSYRSYRSYRARNFLVAAYLQRVEEEIVGAFA